MTGREYYIQHGYDELPESVRKEMSRVFDTGVNNSGVWVRFKEVENLAGIMAYAFTHRTITTNADRIRAMSDEELANTLKDIGMQCPDGHFVGDYDCFDGSGCASCWLDWLGQEVDDGEPE